MSNNINNFTSSTKKLNNESETPFYTQIMAAIKHDINTGLLKPGDMITPEMELSRIYGVSRTTVRQAMDQLTEEGLITRRRGKGSFVSNAKLSRNLDHLYSFTDDMRKLSLEPNSVVVESTVVNIEEKMAAKLRLPLEAKVFKLVRLRCANNEPLLFESTYIPVYLCPGIEQEDFSKTSLYQVLKLKYNINMSRAEETYEAVKLSKEVARSLKCASASAAFNVKRIAYIENDIPFEYTSSFVRSDKCIFKVELKADKRQINFSREITP